jgi:transcriptional regulator with XRE-family HTH domain
MLKFIDDPNVAPLAQKRIDDKIAKDWQFALNVSVLQLSEEISKQLIQKNLSRAQFAKILGTSRSYVTKLLTSKPNLTLSSLFKITSAIGLRPVIKFEAESFDLSKVEIGMTAKKVVTSHTQYFIRKKVEYETAD